MTRGLGYLPDEPDDRDVPFAAMRLPGTPPDAHSLRHRVRSVLDQGSTNSCVAHSVAQALRMLDGGALASRLYLYFNARAYHRGEYSDVGTYLRTCFKALMRFGRPPEEVWPFESWRVNVRPDWRAHQHAFDRRGVAGYTRIVTSGDARLNDIRTALAAGFPIVFGTAISHGFVQGHAAGTLEPPRASDVAGLHAMVITGYEPGRFEVVNSWGTDWNAGGFCYLSDRYLADERTQDLWMVKP